MHQFIERHFLPGDVLFLDGAKGDAAYILKDGQVEISRVEQEQKIVVTVLHPVTIFGELALLLGEHRRTSTARALTKVRVLELPREEFNRYLETSHQFVSLLVETLARRMEKTTERAARAPDVFTGVCRILDTFATDENFVISYEKLVKNLASVLITSPESIINVLRLLESSNLIEVSSLGSGRSMRVQDPENFLQRTKNLRKAIDKLDNLA